MDGYVPVRIDPWAGWCLEEFDLRGRWEDIQARLANEAPFYSTEPHRKVFRFSLDPGTCLYVKVEDLSSKGRSMLRSLESSPARRYFANYSVISRHGVPSPKVLFCLERRARLLPAESRIATLELLDHEPLPSFLEKRRREDGFERVKARLLHGLARTTARLHRLGLYFSLDGRNLFVHAGDASVAVLDLDHMKRGWLGRIPKRRRERNLARLRMTLGKIEGATEGDFERFLEAYECEMR